MKFRKQIFEFRVNLLKPDLRKVLRQRVEIFFAINKLVVAENNAVKQEKNISTLEYDPAINNFASPLGKSSEKTRENLLK